MRYIHNRPFYSKKIKKQKILKNINENQFGIYWDEKGIRRAELGNDNYLRDCLPFFIKFNDEQPIKIDRAINYDELRGRYGYGNAILVYPENNVITSQFPQEMLQEDYFIDYYYRSQIYFTRTDIKNITIYIEVEEEEIHHLDSKYIDNNISRATVTIPIQVYSGGYDGMSCDYHFDKIIEMIEDNIPVNFVDQYHDYYILSGCNPRENCFAIYRKFENHEFIARCYYRYDYRWNDETGQEEVSYYQDVESHVNEFYNTDNPPPYPVTSVNGATGDVTINTLPSSSTSNNDQVLKVVNGTPTWSDSFTAPSYFSTSFENWTTAQFNAAFNDFQSGKPLIIKDGGYYSTCLAATFIKGLSLYVMEFIQTNYQDCYKYFRLEYEDGGSVVVSSKTVPYMPESPTKGYVLTGNGSSASWEKIESLPSYTTDNNDQFLKIVDGHPQWTTVVDAAEVSF